MGGKKFLIAEYVKSCLKSCEKAYIQARLVSDMVDSVPGNKEEPDENQDNEWKELCIDNLPNDIVTGDYEFLCDKKNLYPLDQQKWFVINEILFDLAKGRPIMYRKSHPETKEYKDIGTIKRQFIIDVVNEAIMSGLIQS